MLVSDQDITAGSHPIRAQNDDRLHSVVNTQEISSPTTHSSDEALVDYLIGVANHRNLGEYWLEISPSPKGDNLDPIQSGRFVSTASTFFLYSLPRREETRHLETLSGEIP